MEWTQKSKEHLRNYISGVIIVLVICGVGLTGYIQYFSPTKTDTQINMLSVESVDVNLKLEYIAVQLQQTKPQLALTENELKSTQDKVDSLTVVIDEIKVSNNVASFKHEHWTDKLLAQRRYHFVK